MKKYFLHLLLFVSTFAYSQSTLDFLVPNPASQYPYIPNSVYMFSISDDAIQVRWQNLGSLTYEYQYADNIGFTANLVQGTTSNDTLVISGLSPSTTKYFKVR